MAIASRGRKLAPEADEATAKAVKPTGKLDLKAQGESILLSKSEEEQAKIGSKSHTLEFISLITNPYFPVSRREKSGEIVKGEETVGAILKNVGDEPIEVLTLPNKSYEVMDVDFEKASSRTIQPGEEFQVNSAEVAELLTRDEYGSRITGGGKVVTYTTQAPKDPTKLPTTKLRIKDGSVKDYSVSIAEVSEDGKTKVMKPEFEEKFGIFSTRGTRTRSVSGKKSRKRGNPAGFAVHALFQQKLGGRK